MRKLATIRRILNILPIENADAIELAQVDGWNVVIKKGEYKIGDQVVYLEVDSWVPHELAPFLSKEKDPKEFNGVKGERLRTMKLRGALSQGLILPVSILIQDGVDGQEYPFIEGSDVTEILGIQKWERPISAQLAGQVRGNFPINIPKTDQERVQNLPLDQYLGELYEVTEKLHGASCTFYLDLDGEFHVCSRNLDLKPDANNSYWKAAYKYNVEAEMQRLGLNGYAIQGELCGEGINGNNYKLALDFFVFDVYIVGEGYASPYSRHYLVEKLGLKHVPIVDSAYHLLDSKEELLRKADGKSLIADCQREGYVYKSHLTGKSFKTVSNAWLLKYE